MRFLCRSAPILHIRSFVQLFFSIRGSQSAAALAYFLVLTFFPLLICVNAFVASLQLDMHIITDSLTDLLPSAAADILTDYTAYISVNQTAAMLLAGLITAMVSASAAVRTLMSAIGSLYGRSDWRGLKHIAASIVFSLLLLVTVYLSLAVLITGNWFFRLLESSLRLTLPFARWNRLRFILLFALALFFILLIYGVCTPRLSPRPPVLPGAFLASATLVGASVLFSWFIGMSSRYSLVYGSLASTIILLVWLYLCGNILILGSVFNRIISSAYSPSDKNLKRTVAFDEKTDYNATNSI